MNTFFSRTRAGRRSRRLTLVGMTGTLVVAAGGVGYAAWSSTATGSSQATSGAPVVGTVSPATPVDTLYPGGSTALYFTVTNPNGFPVTYSSAAFGAVTSSSPTCAAADYVTTANQPVSVTVPAGGTSSVLSPAGAITLDASAPDACQNVTFTVATTVTGVSG